MESFNLTSFKGSHDYQGSKVVARVVLEETSLIVICEIVPGIERTLDSVNLQKVRELTPSGQFRQVVVDFVGLQFPAYGYGGDGYKPCLVFRCYC